ncbi:hypothetical protein KI387_032862, partial [Taxus chinensis]
MAPSPSIVADGNDLGVYNGTCLDECLDNYSNNNVSNNDKDLESIVDAVTVLLRGLGEDVEREGIKKTPLRVARAFLEGTKGYQQNIKNIIGDALFPEAGIENGAGCGGGSGGLVVVRNIDLFSYCEACLLPFKARLHVAYISSCQRVVGLSKFSRVAEAFAKRLQSPQRLADDICKALSDNIKPLGVALILECLHIQFPKVEDKADELKSSIEDMPHWMPSSFFAGSGLFENESNNIWNDFIELLQLGGISVSRHITTSASVSKGIWCPFPVTTDSDSSILNGKASPQYELNCNGSGPNCGWSKSSLAKLEANSSMITAVKSILSVIAGDSWKEKLCWTPIRYVWWLSNFHRIKPVIQFMHFQGNCAEADGNGSSGKTDVRMAATEAKGKEILWEVRVPFCSQCEHHLLPFFGTAHIGYISVKQQKQVIRPKICNIVEFFCHRLQVQERLTRQIAEAISSSCNVDSVIVVLEANHICMQSRGVEKIGSSTATVAVLGCFITDSALKAAFFERVSDRT